MAKNGIETPSYVVLQKLAKNIEIRKYFPSKWTCAVADGPAGDYRTNLSGNMFNKLFRYISGENNYTTEIKMTSPVVVDYKSLNNKNIDTSKVPCTMQMGFFLPKEFHNDSPFPIREGMYTKIEPEMTVAVIRYNGYTDFNTIIAHKFALIEALGDSAKFFDCQNLVTAGYNAPFDPVQTHEVWLRKI